MQHGSTSTQITEMRTFNISKHENLGISQLVNQQNKTFKTVDEFVNYFAEDPSKRRNIRKVLVATNGIAAVKCIISMRKLLSQVFHGQDRIIKFVCMTTEQEVQSKAEYLKYADHVVFSPAGANTNNYANVNEIVEHAVREQVDAVWAGWGHASENPRLPEKLAEQNIIFIGPPAHAMFALGDKIASTIIAQTVDIPTIEWSGSGIKAEGLDPRTNVAELDNLCKLAYVNSVEDGMRALREKNITYPVMIKASEGGGGKGIRKCENDAQFKDDFRRVKIEVPGSPIFIMKCMINARHIEVQLIADQYGNVIPIFTRDCSIQRRCQKIIEEAPAGIAPTEVLAQMQQDAVNLAKQVGYVSAGTVEYLYLPETKKYYFLELNPRLQVEHPCTEMISNINIPAVQLQVAMGVPLHRIVDIRLFYGLDRYGNDPLPADRLVRTDTNICVIAARITSEDPADDFRPASGNVETLNFQSNQNVWGYFSVSSTGKVHEYADSQFGHLFAKGTTRHEAISALMCALKELELRTSFASQVNYLVGLLHDPDFEHNRFHTGWLDQRIRAKVQSMPELPLHVTIAIGATVIGHAKITEVFSKFQSAIERGQILPTSELTETFELELVHNNVKYSVMVNRYGVINFLVRVNDSEVYTEVREVGNGNLLVTYSDESHTCYLEEEVERYKVSIGRTLTIFEKENDPSVLRSRNAGRLLQYLVKDGEHVAVGETFAEMESMKMVINLEVKKAGGRLVYVARPGQALFPGTLIARLDDQGDMSSSKPKDFVGSISEWKSAEDKRRSTLVRLNARFDMVVQSCKDILNGYAVPESLFEQWKTKLIDDLFAVLDNPKLPFSFFQVMMNVVETRMSRIANYNRICELYKHETKFKAVELAEEMQNYLSSLNPSELGVEKQHYDELLKICEHFEHGLEGHKRLVVIELLEAFLETEIYFQDVSYDKGVSNVKSVVLDPVEVVRKVYSHTRIRIKNELLKEIIRRLDINLIYTLQPVLKKVANLFNQETEPLALFVRETLNKMHHSRRTDDRSSIQELLKKCSNENGDRHLKDFLKNLTANTNQLVLHEFFFTQNKHTNAYAIRLFIRQSFYVGDDDIQELETRQLFPRNNVSIFKFEVGPNSPLYVHDPAMRRSIYFLSVLPELDLLRREELLQILKKNVTPDARNTLLLVALPRGQNGFSNAASYTEHDLRKVGRDLRTEVALKLKINVPEITAVDLMISRAGHPPLYTHYDFSANEKLEIYRLPSDKVDISVENSSYLLFRHNDRGISRIFVRYLLSDVASIIAPERYSDIQPIERIQTKLVDVIDGACGEIRVQTAADKTSIFDCNHLMINLEYDSRVQETEGWWRAAEGALRQYEKYLIKHRITEVEIGYQDVSGLAGSVSAPGSVRVIYTNETGAIGEVGVYRTVGQKLDPIRHGFARYAGTTRYDGHRPIANVNVQKKRYQAHRVGTTYVYDFPVVIAQATLDLWKLYKKTNPLSYERTLASTSAEFREALESGDASKCARCYELILESEDAPEIRVCEGVDIEKRMRERAESAGNDRGMIAWLVRLRTPDSPNEGRQLVLISNDITYKAGSFSMREHRLYHRAGEFCRRLKIPRIYIAANSGARIGYAEDVRRLFHLKFIDDNKPEEGFSYLYLNSEDATPELLKQVESTKLKDGSYRLDAIIGKETDLGVENLVGSGLIAGESSRAYDEIPTYCLVTGRAVGIGAYVARLLRRVVQVQSSDLVLTGANAVNAVLGRQIYTSNSQLGGPEVMFRNGVSYDVVQNDLEGLRQILLNMSYLPETVLTDDPAREVEASPRKGPYDIRDILDSSEGDGLFDRGSFKESIGGWARTIIVGRARLRGLHVGVVTTETNTVEFEIPADPATEDSQARTVFQAGQVWYPDSAYKTADAIRDFHREGLPLVILANIRGFSGGKKDMFEMVLKFGAQIVDALQAYTQPIIVYIPPYGELRGGAWAVLDTQINSTCITMLADRDARGGVLEPTGIVEIKFRQGDLFKLMAKDDSGIRRLEDELKRKDLTEIERAATTSALEKRRELLTSTFHSGAVKFSDLMDMTARMLSTGAIHDEVLWRDARNYFFDLFEVKLVQFRMARRYATKVMGVADEDITIRHLERAVRAVLQHLKDKKITYRLDHQSETSNGHRRFDYTATDLKAYERSAEFVHYLEQLALKRMLKDLFSCCNAISQTEAGDTQTVDTLVDRLDSLLNDASDEECVQALVNRLQKTLS
ncbi:hypothetical protein M3Y95_00523900 [Aphelenchoides besseyi]|nr:hypothetical protein M3Y95_00523900 [Aphelenchoides besseyi]